jgi:hypothetical protein
LPTPSSSLKSSPLTPTPVNLRPLAPAAIAGVLVALYRTYHFVPISKLLLLLPYWAWFYLTNYQGGFRRRAVIGSILRLFYPHGVPVLVMNAIAILVMTTYLLVFGRALLRSAKAPTHRVQLWTFALFASALGGIPLEVLGDTLQIVLLLFCGFMVWTRSHIRSDAARLGCGLAALAVSAIIHEGSIFFLAPALPFFVKQRPRLVDFIPSLLAFVGVLALSNHFSGTGPRADFGAITYPGHEWYPVPIFATPVLKDLLAAERYLNFGTREFKILFAWKLVGISALAFSLLSALFNILRYEVFKRAMQVLLVILIVLPPLFCIAHDWGRFLVHATWIAVVATMAGHNNPDLREQGLPRQSVPRLFRTLAATIRKVNAEFLIVIACIFALLNSSNGWNYMPGFIDTTAGSFLVIVAVAGIARVIDRRNKSIAVS